MSISDEQKLYCALDNGQGFVIFEGPLIQGKPYETKTLTGKIYPPKCFGNKCLFALNLLGTKQKEL